MSLYCIGVTLQCNAMQYNALVLLGADCLLPGVAGVGVTWGTMVG